MLDILNRGLLFITNITGHTSGKYSWKSYPVQRNSLATDNMPAGGERPPQKETKRPEHTKGNLSQQPALFYPKNDYRINTFHPAAQSDVLAVNKLQDRPEQSQRGDFTPTAGISSQG